MMSCKCGSSFMFIRSHENERSLPIIRFQFQFRKKQLNSNCIVLVSSKLRSIRRNHVSFSNNHYLVNNNNIEEEEEEEDEEEEEIERKVHCEVEVISWRERRIKAQIPIHANIHSVWNALTDYERLADFIPNLVSR